MMSEQKINIPKLGMFLGIVAAVAAALLSIVYASTETAIQVNQQKKTNTALEQVLPASDNVPSEDVVEVALKAAEKMKFYVARKSGAVVGFAGVYASEGFSGPVEVMVGFNADGSVRKVIVTKNTETPGLGTVITDRKVQKTIVDVIKGGAALAGMPPNVYLDQYDGRKARGGVWSVAKDGGDVDAKTGATITSRAVCRAVYTISQTAADHLEELVKGAE